VRSFSVKLTLTYLLRHSGVAKEWMAGHVYANARKRSITFVAWEKERSRTRLVAGAVPISFTGALTGIQLERQLELVATTIEV
jgi:hypothetical protein